jgi:hypothetical protein
MQSTASSTSSSSFEKWAWGAAGLVNFPVNFVTQGVADVLGLETLRHGTCWTSYASIRTNGIDPTRGGGKRGSGTGHNLAGTGDGDEQQKVYIEHSKGKFFAYLDSSSVGETTTSVSSEYISETLIETRITQIFMMNYCREELFPREPK